MTKDRFPVKLFCVTGLLIVILTFRLTINYGSVKPDPELPTGVAFVWDGVTWLVPGGKCVDHQTAVLKTPPGFQAPSEQDLQRLSSSLQSPSARRVRTSFPFLFREDATVWTNHKKEYLDSWWVVALSTGESSPHVPDYCAYVLVRKSP